MGRVHINVGRVGWSELVKTWGEFVSGGMSPQENCKYLIRVNWSHVVLANNNKIHT